MLLAANAYRAATLHFCDVTAKGYYRTATRGSRRRHAATAINPTARLRRPMRVRRCGSSAGRRLCWLAAAPGPDRRRQPGAAASAGRARAAGAKAQAPRPAQSGPLEVDITQGTLKPIPIAVPEFLGEDPQFALEVSDVVAADLERSGLFEPLDRASFIDRPRDLNAPPRFQDWRVINAQALVVGRAGRAPDGRVVGEFRLWDVLSGRQLASPAIRRRGRRTGAGSAISSPTRSISG